MYYKVTEGLVQLMNDEVKLVPTSTPPDCDHPNIGFGALLDYYCISDSLLLWSWLVFTVRWY